MSIRVEHLNKRFGAHVAVDDVSFEVKPGELVALLGPSGGGKSTVLRTIAGLELADSGEVWLDGQRVDHLHARARKVGFVFQHYALFRHMTVWDNIAFGLQVQEVPMERQKERVGEMLRLMALDGFGDRLPSQLSGGQRQRVALARALAPEPRLLLLDEPFGAIDAKVREELRRWLRRLHDEVELTSIFVTHDQEEAFAVADRVFLFNKGRLEQEGPPEQILDNPATEFVARFVGEVNVFDGVIQHGLAVSGPLRWPVAGMAEGQAVRMIVRAYDLKFWREEPGVAKVTRLVPLGDRVKVEARMNNGETIFAQFPRRSSLLKGVEAGSPIAIELTLARVFPREG